MGGAIGALYLEQHPGVFSSAILSSPMLQVNAGVIPIPIVWALLWMKKLTKADKVYARGQRAFDGVPRFNTSSCLSEERYQHIFAKRMQERRYQTYGASWGWTLASLRAVRKLQKQAKKVDAPVLILQAEMDTMVGNKGQDAFARKSKNTMIVVVPGAKHEIYNGNSEMRQKFYYEIFHFLMEQ
jgi:lysophospholipase